MSLAPDSEWAQVGAVLLAPGPGRDAWQINRSQMSITTAVPTGKAPTLLGYTVDHYTTARADLRLVTREYDGSMDTTTAAMVWSPPGRWLLLLADPADRTPTKAAITSPPAGLIPFAHTT
ncbi:hypothetical protein [Williamsia sterculiae]|nr:hypothetical protein [Williamsia sterculiae]